MPLWREKVLKIFLRESLWSDYSRQENENRLFKILHFDFIVIHLIQFSSIITVLTHGIYFVAAGDAFSRSAQIQVALKSNHDGATNYCDAANCYKKTDPNGKERTHFVFLSTDIFWQTLLKNCNIQSVTVTWVNVVFDDIHIYK